jgi:hypothetical protein
MADRPLAAIPSRPVLALLVITLGLIPFDARAGREADEAEADKLACYGDALYSAAQSREDAGRSFNKAASSQSDPVASGKAFSNAAQQYEFAATDFDGAAQKNQDAAQKANDPKDRENNFKANSESAKCSAMWAGKQAKDYYKNAAAAYEKNGDGDSYAAAAENLEKAANIFIDISNLKSCQKYISNANHCKKKTQ